MTTEPTFEGMRKPSFYENNVGSSGTDGTSQEAGEALKPVRATLQRIALATFERLGPATTLECVKSSGVGENSIRPRVSELRDMGLVEPTGERQKNPSGKSAAVLRLTDAGRAMLHGR